MPDAPQPPVNVPIYATSTFEVADATELAELLEFARPGHSYTRYSNPTHDALERALAELEGGEAALVTASGMAAIHAVILSVLRAGDEIVIPRAVYGGTIGLARTVLERSGIAAPHRRHHRSRRGRRRDRRRARSLLWLETISNPTTAMADVAALAELAHARGVLVGRGQHLRLAGARQPARPRRRLRRALDDEVHRRPLRPHGRRGGGQRGARAMRHATSWSTPAATRRHGRRFSRCAG